MWTGKASPTLEDKRKELPELFHYNRRPIERAFMQSVSSRDHPETAEDRVVDAFPIRLALPTLPGRAD